MVVDKIENIGKYASLNPLFAEAIEYLTSHDFLNEEVGKRQLKGKDLYINISQTEPKTKEEARLETHALFIDIQIPILGDEVMGYTPTADLGEISQQYDTEKDITFYRGLAENYINVRPGMFAIFFPQDGHAPGITPTGVKKIIVKVRVQG